MSAGEARPAPPRHRGGPVLLAVADDPRLFADLRRELEDRYARDYRVSCVASAAEARTALDDFAAAGVQVALVLAGELQGDTSGTELLAEVQRTHAQAQRVLLVGWGRLTEPEVGDTVFEAVSRGRLDHFLIEPSLPPDEEFHQAISSFLLAYAESGQQAPHTVDVVGRTWSGRAAELREVLGRCALPHRFHLAGSETGRAVLASAGSRRLPLIRMPDGNILEDPTDGEIASASGTTIDPDGDRYDLVIVGGGPAGLSAAVYGSSEGLRTLVIDSGGIGGQATASSAIRNYLGFPRGVSGGELARRAYQQAWVFGTRFALMQRVTELSPGAGRHRAHPVSGGVAIGRAVVLATGASYRLLGVAPLEALHGAGVFYGAAASEAPTVCRRRGLRRRRRQLRRPGGAPPRPLRPPGHPGRAGGVARCRACRTTSSSRSRRPPTSRSGTGTEVVDGGGDGWLQHLVLRRRDDGAEQIVDADDLFLMIGATPHTDWLPPDGRAGPGGFVMTGSDVRGAASRRSPAARWRWRRASLGPGRRRRAPRLGEARRVRGRGGLDRHPAGPPAGERLSRVRRDAAYAGTGPGARQEAVLASCLRKRRDSRTVHTTTDEDRPEVGEHPEDEHGRDDGVGVLATRGPVQGTDVEGLGDTDVARGDLHERGEADHRVDGEDLDGGEDLGVDPHPAERDEEDQVHRGLAEQEQADQAQRLAPEDVDDLAAPLHDDVPEVLARRPVAIPRSQLRNRPRRAPKRRANGSLRTMKKARVRSTSERPRPTRARVQTDPGTSDCVESRTSPIEGRTRGSTLLTELLTT